FVIVLHGAGLYGLWSYQMIPAADEAITLMVDLISPPAPKQPKSPVAEPVKPPKPQHIEPPKPQQLVAETAVVLPNEPIAPPPVQAPVPVIAAPALPPQVVTLSGELSVSCPERLPPTYPPFSIRLNEQGKVVLRVELDAVGRISNVSFKTHSGFSRLDEAAVNAVKTWRCKPAIRNGVAVPAVALQPFDFILEGR
ncbi:MAG: energy transducer TonB, partial [Gallionellales bacterium RIFOXYB12_FULL_54_9]